tara:strand:+ start:283 stop:600 length:318 start_codon:yes stop_codon:yes gene_type:complete
LEGSEEGLEKEVRIQVAGVVLAGEFTMSFMPGKVLDGDGVGHLVGEAKAGWCLVGKIFQIPLPGEAVEGGVHAYAREDPGIFLKAVLLKARLGHPAPVFVGSGGV